MAHREHIGHNGSTNASFNCPHRTTAHRTPSSGRPYAGSAGLPRHGVFSTQPAAGVPRSRRDDNVMRT